MQVAEYISEDFIILPGEPPQDVLHGVQPLFSVIDFCTHIEIAIKRKHVPIKRSSVIIKFSLCATGESYSRLSRFGFTTPSLGV